MTTRVDSATPGTSHGAISVPSTSVSSYLLGPMRVALIRVETGCAIGHGAPTPAHAADHSDCLQVRLLLEGEERVEFGREPLELHAGDLYVREPGRTFGAITRGCELIALSIAPSHLSREEAGSLHGKVLRQTEPLCQMLGGHLRRLVQMLPTLMPSGVDPVVNVTSSLLNTCLGFSCKHVHVNIEQSADPLRKRISAHIDAHLSASDLSVKSLQRTFHLSRARLYRIMAPEGGVAHLIARKRMDAAFRDIRNHSERSLQDIAAQWGFGSLRQFQRAFRARFDCSPGAVRRMESEALVAVTVAHPRPTTD